MKKIIYLFALVLLSCNTSVKSKLKKEIEPCNCYKYTQLLIKHQTPYKRIIMPSLTQFKRDAKRRGNDCEIHSTFKGVTILGDTTESIRYKARIKSTQYGKEYAKINVIKSN